MRWRGLLARGLSICELEGKVGTMGHPFGLVASFLCCMAVHLFG